VRGSPKTLDRLLERLHIDELILEEFENTLEVLTFEEDFEVYLEKLV
jgi:hypothetical protein